MSKSHHNNKKYFNSKNKKQNLTIHLGNQKILVYRPRLKINHTMSISNSLYHFMVNMLIFIAF